MNGERRREGRRLLSHIHTKRLTRVKFDEKTVEVETHTEDEILECGLDWERDQNEMIISLPHKETPHVIWADRAH